MSAKETILGNIRKAKKDAGLPVSNPQAVKDRIKATQNNLIPELGKSEGEARLDQFLTKAQELVASTAVLNSEADVPQAIATFLKDNNQPNHVLISEGSDLSDLNWSDAPLLEVKKGMAEPREATVLTRTFAGVAETGSIMVLSDKANPPGNMFLPENHIAIIRQSQIEASLEDVWKLVRKDRDGKTRSMPRSANLISGPSRTGDINATMYMGAHGPKRLHILVIKD